MSRASWAVWNSTYFSWLKIYTDRKGMDGKFVQYRIKTWNKSIWALAEPAWERSQCPRGTTLSKSFNLTHLSSLVGIMQCLCKLNTCQKISARHCLKLTLWISSCMSGYYLLRCIGGKSQMVEKIKGRSVKGRSGVKHNATETLVLIHEGFTCQSNLYSLFFLKINNGLLTEQVGRR